MSKKRLFVVSDVHGHYTLLTEALSEAGFDKDNPDHIFISCGDLLDRGSENLQLLKFVESLKHKILIRGNHESLLLQLIESGKMQPHNYINGTLQTIENLFGKYALNPLDDTIDFSGKTSTVRRLQEFIESSLNFVQSEHYVFTHAWIPPNCKESADLSKFSDETWEKARWVRWADKYDGTPPLSDKTLVVGHYPVTLGGHKFDKTRKENALEIFSAEGLYAIDAATFETKHINVLVLEDNL